MHKSILVYEMDGHWKDLACVVRVSTHMCTKPLTVLMELGVGRELRGGASSREDQGLGAWGSLSLYHPVLSKDS